MPLIMRPATTDDAGAIDRLAKQSAAVLRNLGDTTDFKFNKEEVLHPNGELIQKFYSCFQARDAAGMSACYHPDVTFSDPVFRELHGAQVSAMWHMLCARATDLQITFNVVDADDKRAAAHWEAHYSFGRAKRHVHNIIDATFAFRDTRIIEHIDRFDLWRWTRMALGPMGQALGWTPMLQSKVHKDARQGLDTFIHKHTAQDT
ncbi:MAG: nuclear transport factor 2 family protein [Candidatus Limnocylindria bacterium]